MKNRTNQRNNFEITSNRLSNLTMMETETTQNDPNNVKTSTTNLIHPERIVGIAELNAHFHLSVIKVKADTPSQNDTLLNEKDILMNYIKDLRSSILLLGLMKNTS